MDPPAPLCPCILTNSTNTHVVGFDDADLRGGQVDSESVLPVRQELQETRSRLLRSTSIKTRRRAAFSDQDCAGISPEGSRPGRSRRCSGWGCPYYLLPLASGCQGTRNHLRRIDDDGKKRATMGLGLRNIRSSKTLLDCSCQVDLHCPLIVFGSFTWIGFLCESNDVFAVDVVVLWTR